MRFGIRLYVITRNTAEAAWAESRRLLDAIDPETIKSVQAGLARSEVDLPLSPAASRTRVAVAAAS